jgi:PAS domain S-box-containing protein
LAEAFERFRNKLRRDPFSTILDSNLDLAFQGCASQADRAALRRELDRIVQKIGENLFKPIFVAEQVVSWNQGARRIKGYEASEIIGRHFSCFYTAADQQRGLAMRALKAAAATGHYRNSGWRARKDGSMFLADVVVTAVKDENGSLIGFSKVTRDVTETRVTPSRTEIDPATLESDALQGAAGD